ncbi:phage holin family protein [Rahnella laticis]|uniref:phage holin family protein n=1 Tax=Rahnella laticis TaxID=2787622 RepID=UPI0018A31D41|nr:phage holin family protein [Rahnella laticis]MBF7995412.1 phage holin family protein [Rahnella laticis]
MIGAANARDVVLMDPQIVRAIIGMSAWGGVVRYIMLRKKKPIMEEVLACLLQIVVSCFTGVLLSIFVLSHDANDDKLLIMAGLGGVFAGPIITLLGKKIASMIDTLAPPTKTPE